MHNCYTFTSSEACKIVGISYRQFNHWASFHNMFTQTGTGSDHHLDWLDVRRLAQVRDMTQLGGMSLSDAIEVSIDLPLHIVVTEISAGAFDEEAEAQNEVTRLASKGYSSCLLTFVDPIVEKH